MPKFGPDSKFSPKFSTFAEPDVKFSSVFTQMLILLNAFERDSNWTYGATGPRTFNFFPRNIGSAPHLIRWYWCISHISRCVSLFILIRNLSSSLTVFLISPWSERILVLGTRQVVLKYPSAVPRPEYSSVWQSKWLYSLQMDECYDTRLILYIPSNRLLIPAGPCSLQLASRNPHSNI